MRISRCFPPPSCCDPLQDALVTEFLEQRRLHRDDACSFFDIFVADAKPAQSIRRKYSFLIREASSLGMETGS